MLSNYVSVYVFFHLRFDPMTWVHQDPCFLLLATEVPSTVTGERRTLLKGDSVHLRSHPHSRGAIFPYPHYLARNPRLICS